MAEVRMRTLLLATGGTALLVAAIVATVLVLVLDSDRGERKDVSANEESDGVTQESVEKDAPPKGPPLYKTIDPSIVVNFESDSGPDYLQVKIELMARSQSVLERVQLHMPAIRNDLILLLSQQDPVALRSHSGKTELRSDILEAVRAVAAEGAPDDAPNVEAVYFTNFVMQ